jgi:Uma2 family endonuclease
MYALLEQEGVAPWVLQMPEGLDLTDDQFFEFCVLNRKLLRIERTAEGEILIMSPTGARGSNQNLWITMQLALWAESDGTGVAFDSNGGFTLPNNAMLSPDAAWVARRRLAPLTAEEKGKFLPLCPDFVVELRSPSDRLADLKRKMEEYISNGALLGWLIEPFERQVFVYRPNQPIQQLDQPPSVDAGPELPGFVLDLTKIWEPDI